MVDRTGQAVQPLIHLGYDNCCNGKKSVRSMDELSRRLGDDSAE